MRGHPPARDARRDDADHQHAQVLHQRDEADVRAVGNYALQLVFSDGHERGIFPWGYLRELGAA